MIEPRLDSVLPAGERFDRIVIGAGVFGLHAAKVLIGSGHRVAVIDIDAGTVMRASLVNQARVHNGYHYPRSAYTALRSARYYERFVADFPDAVNARFTKIYAIAATGSLTDAEHFERFCGAVGIRARPVAVGDHFLPDMIQASYETDEYGFDAATLRKQMLGRLDDPAVVWFPRNRVCRAEVAGTDWAVTLADGTRLRAGGVVNASYAGVNAVLRTFGQDPLPLKYELCEIALVDAPRQAGLGITVMDGPFFSLMPFGHTGLHSLTAVPFTPRRTSSSDLPVFGCQQHNTQCEPHALANCASCPVRPGSAYPQMRAMAASYLADVSGLRLVEPLSSIKVVLKTTEVDDARPTLVSRHTDAPRLTTVFSGKINTIYDLEEVDL